MALPKLDVPLYDVVCPSGKKVSFRPFLSKEEKLLMIAMESGDTPSILKAAKQILENCVGEVSGIKIDSLPLFDVEFLFLHLRARSIGEIVKLRYKCNGKVAVPDSEELAPCNSISEYEVDLLKIEPKFGEGHNKFIQLTPSVGITMKYPTFNSFQSVARKDLPADEAFAFLVKCIESVNDPDNVVYAKDVPEAEIIEFVDSLNHKQVEMLDKFFDTMPKIETTVHFNCPKCKATEDIVVSGLDSFFV